LVALSYLGVAVMLFGFAKFAHVVPAEPSDIDPHNVSVTAAAE
jgi:hypothetical protein